MNNARQVERIGWLVFLCCWALLPLELPVAQALHGVARPYMGRAYPLLFVGTLVAVSSSFGILTSRIPYARLVARGVQEYLVLIGLFVSVGVVAVLSTIAHQAYLENSVRQLVLGHLAPALGCLYLLLRSPQEQRRAWLWFYAGFGAMLAVSLVFLSTSYSRAEVQVPWFRVLNTGQQMFMWRSTFSEPWNFYAQYIGNANKTSNNILLFMLFSVRLLGGRERRLEWQSRLILWSFWLLGTITLIVLFSRAVLLLFPLVVWASGIVPRMPRALRWGGLGVVAWSAASAWASYGAAFQYLLRARMVDDEATSAIGSLGSRLVQWQQVSDILIDRFDLVLFGFGTSRFGVLMYGSENAGTHNTFIDTFLESGVTGALLLISLIVAMGLKCLHNRRLQIAKPFELFALFVFVSLMVRELSFAYLYATSLAGVALAALCTLLVSSQLWEGDLRRA